MAGSISTLANNGIAAGNAQVGRSGADRAVRQQVGDLGKALANNDVAAAQTAVASLRSAAPTQNSGTDFSNAVKALDQALKSNNTSGAAEAFANLQRAQRRIQLERQGGPAQDVPNRPRVSGASELIPAKVPAAEAVPARATGAGTARIAKQESVEAQRVSSEKSFITRQDLAAKAAQPTPPQADAKPIGSTINTTA
jgi:hypothetical protein